MKVDHKRLLQALTLVRELEEQMTTYCADAKRVPVPWQHVAMAVEAYTGDAIQVVRPNAVDIKELNGVMIRWDDGLVAIAIRHGLPSDVANYTIVKELMHPLIDQPEEQSADADATIEHLFNSSFFGPGSGQNDHLPVVQSEHLAAIAAAAILVPARERKQLLEELAAGKTTVAKAALWLDVPEAIVALAISETVMRYADMASCELLDA